MKTLVVVALTVALAACGSKAKKDTTPAKPDMGSASTGGATYGGKTPAPTPPADPATADPCGGGGPM